MKEDLAGLLKMLLSDTFKGFHIHPKMLILKILPSRKRALRLASFAELSYRESFDQSFS
jgi:hypothetical protein